jgi:hypothetical protein
MVTASKTRKKDADSFEENIMVGSGGISAETAPDAFAAVARPAINTPLSDSNRVRRCQVEAVLAELLETGLRKGFFGTAAVTITFHDGNFQHVHKRLEQTIVR